MAQTRLDVDVAAVVSCWLLAVPAVVWYSVLRHVVWSVQARLDVDVAAAVSYWPPLHVVCGAHARLDVVEHELRALHSRS